MPAKLLVHGVFTGFLATALLFGDCILFNFDDEDDDDERSHSGHHDIRANSPPA